MDPKVIAVTCYTGSERLVQMTERLVKRLPCGVVAVGQGADRQIATECCARVNVDVNKGFAYGINTGIQWLWDNCEKVLPENILVINNDIEPPEDRAWFDLLVSVCDGKRIITPVTDRTWNKAAKASEAKNKNSFYASMVSAFCWLVPARICRRLKRNYGFWMFDEDFGLGYGEDDYTAAILRKKDPTPFKVVPRSWVRHLKAQTAKTVKIDRKRQFVILENKIAKLKRS